MLEDPVEVQAAAELFSNKIVEPIYFSRYFLKHLLLFIRLIQAHIMRFTSTSACLLASASYAVAAPANAQRSTAASKDYECCENPIVRKEW